MLRLAAVVATLVTFALPLPVLGYVVTSAGLFVAAALLLGAPHPGRMADYGWALAAIGSFIAGTIGTLALTFLAPAVADLATTFGPPEYVAGDGRGVRDRQCAARPQPPGRVWSPCLSIITIGLIGIDSQTGQPDSPSASANCWTASTSSWRCSRSARPSDTC
ncbi:MULTISPECIES: tripartite tricarboxylate transporter permease [Actinoalloteichus]|uniref:Tripartite tricarboxylate transporter TctA family n=1 Tax=Actinoalloteichus fjordicus TaxID=1612552 RepID=A0AAC9PUF5_9PSEU|nr:MULTISPECIES: tripartite tricarboxylate transporter permease [Actinoalloteichus]APU17138.1 Tripartite tricarboxylate transporter TctA family [Actinoalloteichus fjordicus]APU23220.1 Tripartite tricarboxylate transporter TctA family [Actinoalloteichus sp. GBA129-24]